LAYGIGLHREFNLRTQDSRAQNIIEVEERRRIFWSIFYLDSILSLVVGRPFTISGLDVDAEPPMSVDDGRITQEGIIPEDIGGEQDEREEYLHEYMQTLSETFRQIYEGLYDARTSKNRLRWEMSEMIQALSEDLSKWRVGVPSALMPFLPGEASSSFATSAPPKIFSTFAYYYASCLILRPALVEVTRSINVSWEKTEDSGAGGPRTELKSLRESADRCVIAGRDLFALILAAPVTSFTLSPYFLLLEGTDVLESSLYPSSSRDPLSWTISFSNHTTTMPTMTCNC
jgi:Fungal specific transcription factor domain